MALTVKGLSVAIAGVPIVSGLDFSVGAGRILGLMGASGAGKSMTALAIMGLLPRGAERVGAISIGGRRIDGLSDKAMGSIRGGQIGMIFQEPMSALNPLMTAGGQIAEVFIKHKGASRTEALGRAEELLGRVGLGAEIGARYPHQLSGGQQQRVMIAMAIALKPAVLIADEATTALDSVTQMGVLGLIRRLAEEDNMAVLLITHDLGVMAKMADDFMIIEGGRVVEQGGIERLDGGLSNPHALALTGANPFPTPSATTKPTPVPPPTPQKHRVLLQVKGASFTYPNKDKTNKNNSNKGIHNINFSLGKGEIVGLVGTSGSGKTTLARIVLGLIAPDEGGVILDGAPLTTPPKGGASQAGVVSAVFQDPYASFNPRHRIGRLVAEPFYAIRPRPSVAEQKQIAETLLAQMGIAHDFMARRIGEASGGQRQRIAFARAMITQPKLIVLDEPVSALDAPIRAVVLGMMVKKAKAEGVAMVLISHDLAVVQAICERVMVMADGRIVEEGATQTLLTTPQHQATTHLAQASLDWKAELHKRFG